MTSIYVEIRIHAALDDLWRLTQSPEEHERWDLRFSRITYLPRTDADEAQRFRYETRLGFGLTIAGEGETVGSRNRDNGERTSALKFWSADPRSLIREGAGYWQYIPTENGLRFLTSYDYRCRFGLLGRVFDRLVFRPLMGWATAWSFDRLRLWLEKGIPPETSFQNFLVHAVARCSIALAWLYQGISPKLLAIHPDEIDLFTKSGAPADLAAPALITLGLAEVALGLLMLTCVRQRWHFPLTIGLLVIATLYCIIFAPSYLVAAFNPVTMNGLMMAMAVIGWISSRNLPTASRCLRRRPGGEV